MPLEDEPEEVDLADLADPDQGSLGAEVNTISSTSQCFAGASTGSTVTHFMPYSVGPA